MIIILKVAHALSFNVGLNLQGALRDKRLKLHNRLFEFASSQLHLRYLFFLPSASVGLFRSGGSGYGPSPTRLVCPEQQDFLVQTGAAMDLKRIQTKQINKCTTFANNRVIN